MTRADSQRRFEELRLAVQRSSSNLVELEIDPSRQLLEASRLQGGSAERWAQASGMLAELWRRQSLLEDLLARAERLRGARHAEELTSLLERESIELSNTTVPLTERRLLDTARASERCSADQLLATMAASFDEVKRAITELTQPWEILTPKLEAARSVLDQMRQLDHEVGGATGVDLGGPSKTLQRLRTQLAVDPMSVTGPQVEELQRELRKAHDELEEIAGFKRGFEARITEARQLIGRLRTTVAAAQAAHAELVLKVLTPDAPPPIEFDSRLEAELDAVAERDRHTAWLDASSRLRAWTEQAASRLAEAQRALEASRAPIQARNQFRGLLEAYQVKSGRLGLLEDPELQEILARAREALYNAPSDLAHAARLVRSYQLALSKTESARRAIA